MTERDRRAPDGAGDEGPEAAPPDETAAAAVAGDPVETDPDLAEPANDSADATDADLTPVGPGQRGATTTRPTPPTVAATPPRRSVDRRAGRMPPQPAAATPSDVAVHIDDRISKIFVLVTVAIFVLILLNGLLLGHGGLLASKPTPTPVASESTAPSSSASPAVSESPAASGSPAASESPAASGAAASPSPS